jgi:hypothetical protein
LKEEALRRARKSTKRIESEEDLEGFNTLADKEQEMIKECIKGTILIDNTFNL